MISSLIKSLDSCAKTNSQIESDNQVLIFNSKIGKHLKRIRQVNNNSPPVYEIILGTSLFNDFKKLPIKCDDLTIFNGISLGNLRLIQVPENAAIVKYQYLKQLKYWPVSFHPDKYLEHILNTGYLSGQHIDTILQKNDDISKAIIFDPKSDKIIASAIDKRDVHPLRHPVMEVIEEIASTIYGAGGWLGDQKNKRQLLIDSDTIVHASVQDVMNEENQIFDTQS
ncbi:hypothetical protein GJ496_010061 [Pomphorhynchus laevis]|nr:hypothetical protein GJ496_010061 [Pomphorhynchus laevis]